MDLRKALHRSGLRFWKHRRPIRGLRCEADLVFPRLRLAVFVDGCFWHGCAQHKSMPVANAEWWEAKLSGNISRDRTNDELLRRAGWVVVRLWEHQSMAEMVDEVTSAVQAIRKQGQRPPLSGYAANVGEPRLDTIARRLPDPGERRPG